MGGRCAFVQHRLKNLYRRLYFLDGLRTGNVTENDPPRFEPTILVGHALLRSLPQARKVCPFKCFYYRGDFHACWQRVSIDAMWTFTPKLPEIFLFGVLGG